MMLISLGFSSLPLADDTPPSDYPVNRRNALSHPILVDVVENELSVGVFAVFLDRPTRALVGRFRQRFL
jgi:hypothetical protein